MSEPKCPECRIVGLTHVISSESNQRSTGDDAWFDVVHCSECGHVYGVFAKVVRQPSFPSLSPRTK